MSEQDVRDGLAGALADEPPLSFDPDRLVARAQREIRRRRSLAGVGGATVVIAVAAVVAGTLLHPTATVATATRLTTPHSSPPTTTFIWPPAGVYKKSYTANQEGVLGLGWSMHLAQTFDTVVPGSMHIGVQAWGGEAGGQITDNQDYLDTFVTFTLHGVPTAVAIQVQAPGQDTVPPSQLCAQSSTPSTCVTFPQADGGLVFVYDAAQNGLRLRTASAYRPDGTVVSVTGYNYDPTASGAPHVQPSVPVTDAQLTKFATDPVLAF
jgi:hypothetical protein